VASYFPSKARTVRDHAAATPEAVLAALKGRSYWHFATHGTFSWDDARQSGLYMSGPALLTVGKLQETDGLGRPRLVVLSACETGLYDIRIHRPPRHLHRARRRRRARHALARRRYRQRAAGRQVLRVAPG
jgi:CHAT domain